MQSHVWPYHPVTLTTTRGWMWLYTADIVSPLGLLSSPLSPGPSLRLDLDDAVCITVSWKMLSAKWPHGHDSSPSSPSTFSCFLFSYRCGDLPSDPCRCWEGGLLRLIVIIFSYLHTLAYKYPLTFIECQRPLGGWLILTPFSVMSKCDLLPHHGGVKKLFSPPVEILTITLREKRDLNN